MVPWWILSIILYSCSCLIWLNIAVSFECFTWDVIRDEMYFIYRAGDFSKSVTLKNNDGRINTICRFDELYYHCDPIPTFLVIHPNIKKEELLFKIKDFKGKDIDGAWSVSQGGKTFSTIVSLSNGFSQSTDVRMTGERNIAKVTVRCFSCRAPYGYNVEFLINGVSEDSLTLNYETGKCTHQLGECNPEVCSCNLSGNEFSRSFSLKNTSTTTNISCDMMFVDRITLTRFSKCATLIYDGTELQYKEHEETTSDIVNPTEGYSSTIYTNKDNNEKDFKGMMIGIVLPVFLFAIITVVTVVYIKSRTKNSKKNIKNEFHKQELNDETKDSMISLLDVAKDESLNKLVEQNMSLFSQSHANCLNNSNDQPAHRMNTTPNNEIIQISKEQSFIVVHSPAVQFDVVFIYFDIDIERKWVTRVVDMLEKEHKIDCGLIVLDLSLDRQNENSFNFIKKNTKVVVTFSKKSGRPLPAIRYIEDISELVVVMVEKCSIPIVRKNMKCIDATKEEEMWMNQLIYAIHYKTDVKT